MGTEQKEKKHHITTIEDIGNVVNHDNFANFMIDFTDVIIRIVEAKKILKEKTGEYPKNLMKDLVWTDDSHRGVKSIEFNDGNVLNFQPMVESESEPEPIPVFTPEELAVIKMECGVVSIDCVGEQLKLRQSIINKINNK